jgi:hypothetical protein
VIGNLFIAVINEVRSVPLRRLPVSILISSLSLEQNFAIAEEEKKARQLENFINRTVAPGHNVTSTWLRRFDPYNYASARSKSTIQRELESEVPESGGEIVTSPDAMQTEFGFDEEKVSLSTTLVSFHPLTFR